MVQDCSFSDERTSHLIPSRALAEQVFSRATGVPLIPGNRIRLLKAHGGSMGRAGAGTIRVG